MTHLTLYGASPAFPGTWYQNWDFPAAQELSLPGITRVTVRVSILIPESQRGKGVFLPHKTKQIAEEISGE